MLNKWRSATIAVVAMLVTLPAVSQPPYRSGNFPGRSNKSPQVGDLAPDFNLKTKDGDAGSIVELSRKASRCNHLRKLHLTTFPQPGWFAGESLPAIWKFSAVFCSLHSRSTP